MTTDDALAMVATERDRQRAKWGGRHHWGVGDCSAATVAVGALAGDVPQLLRLAVLGEEFGEVARAVHDRDPDALTRELEQVAAVAVAWREALG